MSEKGPIAITDLKFEQNYWYRLTEKRKSNKPEIHFYDSSEDENGENFRQYVKQNRCGNQVSIEEVADCVSEVIGTVRLTPKRNLVLTSNSPVADIRNIVERLAIEDSSFKGHFNRIIAVSTRDGKFEETTIVP